MAIEIVKSRPPFIRFEEEENGLNQEASQKAGRPVPRVLTMVKVTSHGSKDEYVAVAEEWLKQKRQQAIQGNYPPDWVDGFEKQYKAYKDGAELPLDGTSVKLWSAIKREQAVRLDAIGYKTIEDLAQVPDSGLGEIGLDGRYLRDLARAWVTESKDRGVAVRDLADAQATIARQAQDLEDLRSRFAALESQISERRGPGRPRKEEAA